MVNNPENGRIEELGSISDSEPEQLLINISEKDRLELALKVLKACLLLGVFVGLARIFWPEPGRELLDIAKTILPSIVTLVLGYYFGQK